MLARVGNDDDFHVHGDLALNIIEPGEVQYIEEDLHSRGDRSLERDAIDTPNLVGIAADDVAEDHAEEVRNLLDLHVDAELFYIGSVLFLYVYLHAGEHVGESDHRGANAKWDQQIMRRKINGQESTEREQTSDDVN